MRTTRRNVLQHVCGGSFSRIIILLFAILALFVLSNQAVVAADAINPGDPATKADVLAAKRDATVAINSTWILVSSALVLFMTIPGLAMFYGGLVRKKNVLSIIMQCYVLMGVLAVIWALYGYSLCFGGDPSSDGNPLIGNGQYLFLENVFPTWDAAANAKTAAPIYKSADGTPIIYQSVHMLFQGMFFVITPGLIFGAFAERMKFSTTVVFTVIWATVIYCPICRWVWNNGYLAYGSPHSKSLGGGALDFAGGTVVHISTGISALVAALVIGKRVGYGIKPMPPHNLTYTALGVGMLWVGWFGFNAGSELAMDEITASTFAATHFSAAAATIAWAGLEWLFRGKPSVLGAASGAVAGLVCITPASGYVTPMSAIMMGLAGGAVCYFACTTIKNKFGYDDSLDVFGVHGVGGTLGAILTGVFATRGINDLAKGKPLGIVDGNSQLIVGQITAVAATAVVAIVGTFVILKVLDMTMGLRVNEQQEQQGLDVSQHGEEGYIFL